jgi:hypothetical protein
MSAPLTWRTPGRDVRKVSRDERPTLARSRQREKPRHAKPSLREELERERRDSSLNDP